MSVIDLSPSLGDGVEAIGAANARPPALPHHVCAVFPLGSCCCQVCCRQHTPAPRGSLFFAVCPAPPELWRMLLLEGQSEEPTEQAQTPSPLPAAV